VSKRPQVASVSAHLVTTNKWVRRLRVDGKAMDKVEVSLLISKSLEPCYAINIIRRHKTGKAADYVEGRVKKRVGEQRKEWPTTCKDTDNSSCLVADAQPLVGGVQCVTLNFGRSPPDDKPASRTGGGGQHGETGNRGGAAQGADGGGLSGGSGRAASRGEEGGGGCHPHSILRTTCSVTLTAPTIPKATFLTTAPVQVMKMI